MWGNRTTNTKLSAFNQLKDLKGDGDKVVALVDPVLKTDKSVTLKLSDGQRTIEGPVSSLHVVFVTTSESDKILENLKKSNISYVEKIYNTVEGTKNRSLYIVDKNRMYAIYAGTSPGIILPGSGNAKYFVKYEMYESRFSRNLTEKLVDFGSMLNWIGVMFVELSPARDDIGNAFNGFSGPISNLLCSGSWGKNGSWSGSGGHLSGCDSAATKLFSPKSP